MDTTVRQPIVTKSMKSVIHQIFIHHIQTDKLYFAMNRPAGSKGQPSMPKQICDITHTQGASTDLSDTYIDSLQNTLTASKVTLATP